MVCTQRPEMVPLKEREGEMMTDGSKRLVLVMFKKGKPRGELDRVVVQNSSGALASVFLLSQIHFHSSFQREEH